MQKVCVCVCAVAFSLFQKLFGLLEIKTCGSVSVECVASPLCSFIFICIRFSHGSVLPARWGGGVPARSGWGGGDAIGYWQPESRFHSQKIVPGDFTLSSEQSGLPGIEQQTVRFSSQT